jgi:monoamine oxidase
VIAYLQGATTAAARALPRFGRELTIAHASSRSTAPRCHRSSSSAAMAASASWRSALSARRRSPTVFRWADEEHIPGCDLAFAPGDVYRFGPWLTKPHGRLHFAGTERSSWPNNMEGALESGERAAREISERQPASACA